MLVNKAPRMHVGENLKRLFLRHKNEQAFLRHNKIGRVGEKCHWHL